MEEPTPGPLSAAESEAVRRLLAEARTDAPMPDEVRSRLDDVLAGLVAERAAGDQPDTEPAPDDRPAPVVQLQLRRRRWAQALVAAAAVTVVGVATTQLVGDDRGQDDAGTTAENEPAASALDDRRGAAEDSAPGDTGGEDQPAAPLSPGAVGSQGDPGLDGLEQYDLGTLRELSAFVRDGDTSLLTNELDSSLSRTTDNAFRSLGPLTGSDVGCGPYYEVDGGRWYAARWQGNLALLLAFPAMDGVRRVEIYDCGSDEPRRAVQVVTLLPGE